MKKILILVVLILSSCAARKVNTDKEVLDVKTDVVSETKQETVSVKDNNINITTDIDELEIVPIDTSKCIEVDGKKYHNVKLRYKKTKKVLVDNTKIKVSKKVLIKANAKKDISVKIFKKEVDKKANYSIYFWWFIILVLIAIGFYTYKKINKTLF